MGRDIEQMSADIGRWMSAVSDVDNAEKKAKNPPEQRYELKTFLNMTYGPQAYNELLQMEGQIRKERKQAIYEREKIKEQIISVIAIIILCLTIVGFLALIFVMLKNKYG